MKYGVQTATNRCRWVCAGVGGCVRAQETRGAQKQAKKGGVYGRGGQYLGAMAGEISPDMMFLGVCQKWSKMSADG